MATTELDPLFIKGLRLLHSKSKDSAEQLRLLLDEVLNQSKQAAVVKQEKHYSPSAIEHETKSYVKKSIREFTDISTVKQSYDDSRKRDAEKRPLDKMILEDNEIIHEAKIPKLEPVQVMSHYPSSPDLPKLDHFVPKRADEDTDCSDDNADAGDFAMEMGLACVICKQLELSHGNQLVECQECHSLYHQDCHRPPVTDIDVNDPRRVWYCAKCMKNMKKMATKSQKPPKPVSSPVAKESNMQARFTKIEPTQISTVLPFKRTEVKAPVTQSSNQNTTNKPIGLAGLAANFSGRVTTPPSSSSSSSMRLASSKPLSSPMKATFSNLSTLGLPTTSKTNNNTSTSSSTVSSKVSSASSYSTSTSSSISSSVKLPSSSTAVTVPKTGISLLSAAASTMASSRAAPSSSNNGGAKPATCSLLMSADKRVQIMKKRAAKLQEKRRLSTK